jgi:hypothetical protein
MRSILFVAILAASASAYAEPSKLHVHTDLVTWDKPLTEKECLTKAKAAILAVDPKLTTSTATHAWAAAKTNWVIGIDCLQSHKLNGAYITVVHNGTEAAAFEKAKETITKSLGGKSEMNGGK